MLLPRLSSILVLFLCRDVCVRAWSMYRVTDRIGDDEIMERIQVIFPGTLWCGSGNKAPDPNQLGRFNETDACCRDHDMCPDIIEAKKSKHGLTNSAYYTRLDCSCDEKFFDCLHRAKERVSGAVGYMYFSGLGTQCFRNDYPIVKCKRKTGIIFKTCLEYELDESQPKKYQWFDVPPYN